MRRIRRRSILGCGLAGAAVILVATAARARARTAEQDLDVLKVLPQNYKLVLDNPMVRVIEAHIPAGSVEPPHRHLRGVSVAMGDYLIEHRDEPEGKWLRSQRKLGTVYWSEAGTHETRNVGTTDSHTIRIEIKF